MSLRRLVAWGRHERDHILVGSDYNLFDNEMCSEGNRNATRLYNPGIAHIIVDRQYTHTSALYHIPRVTKCALSNRQFSLQYF